jgi:hypothetical protein
MCKLLPMTYLKKQKQRNKMPANIISAISPDFGYVNCSQCSPPSKPDGLECRQPTIVEGNIYANAMFKGTELYQSELMSEIIQTNSGAVIKDTWKRARYYPRSIYNSGTLTARDCGFDPQYALEAKTFNRYADHTHIYVHTDFCPKNYKGTTKQGTPTEVTNNKLNEINKDFSNSFSYNLIWGAIGNGGPNSNISSTLAAGNINGGYMNGMITQLWLAQNHNFATEVEQFTIDVAQWVAGQCLYVNVGGQEMQFSQSDFPNVLDLLQSVCSYFNTRVTVSPNMPKPYFQATNNGVDSITLALLNPKYLVPVKMAVQACYTVVQWNCGTLNGVTTTVLQSLSGLHMAPNQFAFEHLTASNTIDYFADIVQTYLGYAQCGNDDLATTISNARMLIDPMMGLQLGRNLMNSRHDATGEAQMGLLNIDAALRAANLPMQIMPLTSLCNTGAVIIMPTNSLMGITDTENGIQGGFEVGVKDAACDTYFIKVFLNAGLLIKNPGDVFWNACGAPYLEQYRNMNVRPEQPSVRNCICPKDCLNIATDYDMSCETLKAYVGSSDSNVLAVQYTATSTGADIVLDYVGKLPNDLLSIEYTMQFDSGENVVTVANDNVTTPIVADTMEGRNISITLTVKSQSCPNGASRIFSAIIKNGQFVKL